MKVQSDFAAQQVNTSISLEKSNDSGSLFGGHAASLAQKVLRDFSTAQREYLSQQASSSSDLRLLALNQLQKRNFQPAVGGLEIPLSGKALGGGRTKSRAQIERQIQSLEVKVAQLERSLGLQGRVINKLAMDMIEEKPRSAEFRDLAVDMNREHGTSENLIRRIEQMNQEIEELKRQLS